MPFHFVVTSMLPAKLDLFLVVVVWFVGLENSAAIYLFKVVATSEPEQYPLIYVVCRQVSLF